MICLAPRALRNCTPSALWGASVRPLNFTVRGRMLAETHCRYCSLVTKVAFWGSRREASWKRPVLLIASLIGTVGCAAVLWVFRGRWVNVALVLWGVLMLYCILGVVVSINGCNSCVARLAGDL